jgi:hypothetical protein
VGELRLQLNPTKARFGGPFAFLVLVNSDRRQMAVAALAAFPFVGVKMLGLFIVLVLKALRVRIRWSRIGGRLRVKSIVVVWSCRRWRRR